MYYHHKTESTQWVSLEVAGAQDDPPLHEDGGEDLDDLARTEGREEEREVDVLQARVQRSRELHCLHSTSPGLE